MCIYKASSGANYPEYRPSVMIM